ncbi:hypothetical protein ACCS56_37970, partial [Rhizobium ruizarguesonis]
ARNNIIHTKRYNLTNTTKKKLNSRTQIKKDTPEKTKKPNSISNQITQQTTCEKLAFPPKALIITAALYNRQTLNYIC